MARSSKQVQASMEDNHSPDQTIIKTDGGLPRPFRRSLAQLPHQYAAALIKPSLATFTTSAGSASWRLVWVQLLAWAMLDALLGELVNLLSPPASGSFILQLFSLATSIGLIIVVPVLFFLLMGAVYMLARAFGGQGTFLQQCYSSLQIQAPLGILSKLLALIPAIGRILNSALSLYGIGVQVVVIMAVHRLSRGKAIAVLLIPVAGIAVFTGAVLLLTR